MDPLPARNIRSLTLLYPLNRQPLYVDQSEHEIMVRVDFSGFDKLERKIEDMKHKGAAGVQLNELFSTDFMIENTDFSSIDDLAEASGISIKLLDDFRKIPEDFFSCRTHFSNWNEMLNAATVMWTKHNIGFDRK
jgi:hypothetical protein